MLLGSDSCQSYRVISLEVQFKRIPLRLFTTAGPTCGPINIYTIFVSQKIATTVTHAITAIYIASHGGACSYNQHVHPIHAYSWVTGYPKRTCRQFKVWGEDEESQCSWIWFMFQGRFALVCWELFYYFINTIWLSTNESLEEQFRLCLLFKNLAGDRPFST